RFNNSKGTRDLNQHSPGSTTLSASSLLWQLPKSKLQFGKSFRECTSFRVKGSNLSRRRKITCVGTGARQPRMRQSLEDFDQEIKRTLARRDQGFRGRPGASLVGSCWNKG